MEEEKLHQALNDFDRVKRKRLLKRIYVLGGFILGIAILIVIVALNKKKEMDIAHEWDKKEFISDSLWLTDVLSKKSPSQQFPSQLQDLEKRIKYNEYASDASKSHLLTILNSIKVNVDTGLIIYDEFDRVTEIKRKTKTIAVSFPEYDKYIIRKEYRGFANNTNRRANRLKQKYHTWSIDECKTVSRGRISIGMNADMVRESWGRPQDINRTTYSFGVHEQWVYSGYNYVYFEDGLVTTIQN